MQSKTKFCHSRRRLVKKYTEPFGSTIKKTILKSFPFDAV